MLKPFLGSLQEPKPSRSDQIKKHLTEAHLATLRAMELLNEEREAVLFIKLETSILMISSCMYKVSKLEN
jgi:hypothetical protein